MLPKGRQRFEQGRDGFETLKRRREEGREEERERTKNIKTVGQLNLTAHSCLGGGSYRPWKGGSSPRRIRDCCAGEGKT